MDIWKSNSETILLKNANVPFLLLQKKAGGPEYSNNYQIVPGRYRMVHLFEMPVPTLNLPYVVAALTHHNRTALLHLQSGHPTPAYWSVLLQIFVHVDTRTDHVL